MGVWVTTSSLETPTGWRVKLEITAPRCAKEEEIRDMAELTQMGASAALGILERNMKWIARRTERDIDEPPF